VLNVFFRVFGMFWQVFGRSHDLEFDLGGSILRKNLFCLFVFWCFGKPTFERWIWRFLGLLDVDDVRSLDLFVIRNLDSRFFEAHFGKKHFLRVGSLNLFYYFL
jgi:hypothetical protein